MKMRERHNEAKVAMVETLTAAVDQCKTIFPKNTSRRWKEIPNCALIKIEMKCQACSGSTAAK